MVVVRILAMDDVGIIFFIPVVGGGTSGLFRGVMVL